MVESCARLRPCGRPGPRGTATLHVEHYGLSDLMEVTLACGPGVLALSFTPGPMVESEYPPTILTALLRVLLMLVGVLVALLFTSFDSG